MEWTTTWRHWRRRQRRRRRNWRKRRTRAPTEWLAARGGRLRHRARRQRRPLTRRREWERRGCAAARGRRATRGRRVEEGYYIHREGIFTGRAFSGLDLAAWETRLPGCGEALDIIKGQLIGLLWEFGDCFQTRLPSAAECKLPRLTMELRPGTPINRRAFFTGRAFFHKGFFHREGIIYISFRRTHWGG